MSLVTEMLRNSGVARFVASLLPSAIKEGSVHRVQLAFNAATLHEFIKRSKSLDEGTLAYLIPALLEPLQQKSPTPTKDTIVSFLSSTGDAEFQSVSSLEVTSFSPLCRRSINLLLQP